MGTETLEQARQGFSAWRTATSTRSRRCSIRPCGGTGLSLATGIATAGTSCRLSSNVIKKASGDPLWSLSMPVRRLSLWSPILARSARRMARRDGDPHQVPRRQGHLDAGPPDAWRRCRFTGLRIPRRASMRFRSPREPLGWAELQDIWSLRTLVAHRLKCLRKG